MNPGAAALERDVAEEIKLSLRDPQALAELLGLEVSADRKQARGVFVLCPWHAERGASCSIRIGGDGTIVVKCHGCGAGGSALDLIAQVNGLEIRRDFRAVLEEGAHLAGLAPLDASKPGVRSRRLIRPALAPPDPSELRALEADVFAELAGALLELCPMVGAPDVQRYLAGRGAGFLESANR